jgi:hypothetical protein
VGDIAAGGLAGQPFGDIPRVAVAALGQLGRRARPGGGQGLVQAQLVADDDVGGVDGGAEVPHEPVQELVQLGFVDGHVLPSWVRSMPLAAG